MEKEQKKIDFFELIDDISRNFRKMFIDEPQNEKEVQDKLEQFFSVKKYNFKREKETTAFSTKSFKPDFTSEISSTAIEVKFVDKTNKVAACVEELSADIAPYSGEWKYILFLVYDKGGNIRDVDEFTHDFNINNDVKIRCIVIKQ